MTYLCIKLILQNTRSLYRNRRYQHERSCRDFIKKKALQSQVQTTRSLRSPISWRKPAPKFFYRKQQASNIIDGIDVVVYTAAIHEDNEEYRAALDRGLPRLSRAELLGQLMTNYQIPIAVSGTHGKTTTTSMLSHILLSADLEQSYHFCRRES